MLIEIDRRVARPCERDNLDVKIVFRRELQQPRQRPHAVSRRQIHEALAHREHPDDGQPLLMGPRQKSLDVAFLPFGDVLE